MDGKALLARFSLTFACLKEDDELLALQMIRVTLQADRLAGLTLPVGGHFDALELKIVHVERFATAWINRVPKALSHLIRRLEAPSTFAILRLGGAFFSWLT